MADSINKPRFFYRGEQITVDGEADRIPVAEKWVVALIKGGGVHVGLTDERGILYPIPSTLNFNKSDKTFRIQQAPVTADRDLPPVTFSSITQIVFFLWPHTKADNTVKAKYISKHELNTDSILISRGLDILLPCPLDIYLERIQKLTERINEEVKHHQNYVNRCMTCAAILDQAHTLLVARGRGLWYSNVSNAGSGSEQYMNEAVQLPEVEIITSEVIEHIREDLERQLNFQSRRLRRVTKRDRKKVAAILSSDAYNQAFRDADWQRSDYTKREAEKINKRAVKTMADAHPEHADAFLDDVGFKRLLSKSAENAGSAESVAKEIKEKANWLWSMTDGILQLAQIKRECELTIGLNIKTTRYDLVGAARFLETRGIAQNVDDLEGEILDAMEGNRLLGADSFSEDIQQKADNYINTSVPGLSQDAVKNLTGGIDSGLKMLELASALSEEKEGIRDDINNMKDGIGVATDIAQLPAVENRIPGLSKLGKGVSKYTGPAGAVTDWAFSIQDLSQASDRTEFAYSVTTYSGKGLVAAGSILALTPLAPLGGVLVGIGTALDIMSGATETVHKDIINFKSVKEKRYLRLMEKKLKNHSPDQEEEGEEYLTLTKLSYDVQVEQKVGDTDAFQSILEQVNSSQARALRDRYADMSIKEFTGNFFSSWSGGGMNWVIYENA